MRSKMGNLSLSMNATVYVEIFLIPIWLDTVLYGFTNTQKYLDKFSFLILGKRTNIWDVEHVKNRKNS